MSDSRTQGDPVVRRPDATVESPTASAGTRAVLRGAALVGMAGFLILLAAVTLILGIDRVATSEAASATASGRSGVVSILVRTSSGQFDQCGSGFFFKPGVVVTTRDERRVGADVYVRIANSDGPLKATPAGTTAPTDIDVYVVEGADAESLIMSKDRVLAGDRVDVPVLASIGVSSQSATISTIYHEDAVFAITFAGAELPDQVGGPVLAADGTVVGVLSGATIRDSEYLVLPAVRIAARMTGLPEPGPPLSSLAGTPTLAVERPPTWTARPRDPLRPDNDGPGSAGGRRAVVPTGPVVARKARILNSPRPSYTAQARENGTEGNVVLRVSLGANGRVKSASVLRGLPDGLNEKAIEAAYRLEFEPARDAEGRPMDSELTVSVNFTNR